MKKCILMFLFVIIIAGCSNVDKLVEEQGEGVINKLDLIDSLIPIITAYELSASDFEISQVEFNGDNTQVINEANLAKIKDYSMDPEGYHYSTSNFIEEVQQARVAVKKEVANYPEELMGVLGLGLKPTFKKIMDLEYLLVVRELEYIAPQAVMEEGSEEPSSYNGGHYRGQILLFDVIDQSFIAAIEIESKNSDNLSLDLYTEDDFINEEELMRALNMDLSNGITEAVVAGMQKQFPLQTRYDSTHKY